MKFRICEDPRFLPVPELQCSGAYPVTSCVKFSWSLEKAAKDMNFFMNQEKAKHMPVT